MLELLFGMIIVGFLFWKAITSPRKIIKEAGGGFTLFLTKIIIIGSWSFLVALIGLIIAGLSELFYWDVDTLVLVLCYTGIGGTCLMIVIGIIAGIVHSFIGDDDDTSDPPVHYTPPPVDRDAAPDDDYYGSQIPGEYLSSTPVGQIQAVSSGTSASRRTRSFEQLMNCSLNRISEEEYFEVCSRAAKEILDFANQLGADERFRTFVRDIAGDDVLYGRSIPNCQERVRILLARELMTCYSSLGISYWWTSKQSTLLNLYTMMMAKSGDVDYGVYGFYLRDESVRFASVDMLETLGKEVRVGSFYSILLLKNFDRVILDRWLTLLKAGVRMIALDDAASVGKMNAIFESECTISETQDEEEHDSAYVDQNDISDSMLDRLLDDFEFRIDKVFDVSTSGVVVTGVVESGDAFVDDPVMIDFLDGHIMYSKIVKLEKYREELFYIQPGDRVGMYLEGLTTDDLDGAVRLTKITA